MLEGGIDSTTDRLATAGLGLGLLLTCCAINAPVVLALLPPSPPILLPSDGLERCLGESWPRTAENGEDKEGGGGLEGDVDPKSWLNLRPDPGLGDATCVGRLGVPGKLGRELFGVNAQLSEPAYVAGCGKALISLLPPMAATLFLLVFSRACAVLSGFNGVAGPQAAAGSRGSLPCAFDAAAAAPDAAAICVDVPPLCSRRLSIATGSFCVVDIDGGPCLTRCG